MPLKKKEKAIHDIHTVKKHYVIEIYAAIIEGKKSSSAISLRLKPGVKYIEIEINHTVKSLFSRYEYHEYLAIFSDKAK